MSEPGAKSRLLMIALPAALAGVLLLSAAGLVIAGYVGRPATGERVSIHVRSSCAPAWQALLAARAEAIGLGEPALAVAGDRVTLTATLPGNPDDRTHMPALLTSPGLLTLHPAGGTPVATQDDLVEARLSMSYMGRATVVLRPSAVTWERIRALPPETVLVATLDGESVALGEVLRVSRDDELHVQPALPGAAEELRMAVDWSIVLGHGTAPCAVTSVSVEG